MLLKQVLTKLEQLAPLALAESWDNVGLLVEPYQARDVTKILTTIDLTEAVLVEAIEKQCELIVSYHPPIFASLKRITQANVKERIVARCFHERIAVYSPHTAWDSYHGGTNDWLASMFPGDSLVTPIEDSAVLPGCGSGRRVVLKQSMLVQDVIKLAKSYLKQPIRAALAEENGWKLKHQEDPQPLDEVRTIGLCAGSGGSLMKGLSVDLYLTGELSHHEVLAAVAAGTHIILSEHTNTERGFLDHIRPTLNQLLDSVEVIVSTADASPLVYH